MSRWLWCVALVAVTSAVAGCSGAHHPMGQTSSPGAPVSTDAPSSNGTVAPSSPLPIPLPVSLNGPTTCTVYDGYATQIIFTSGSLDVRTECLVWAGNRLNVGYLWGYERAAAIPDSTHVCSLTDPHRDLSAMVIEETGSAPVTEAEREKGRSACQNIVATGWSARTPRRPSSRAEGRARQKGARS